MMTENFHDKLSDYQLLKKISPLSICNQDPCEEENVICHIVHVIRMILKINTEHFPERH